jgi:carboxyl-terminal processing protease
MRPTRRVLVGLAWSGFVAMATACGGGSGGSGTIVAPPDSCSVVDQNTFVQDVMLDIYLWADDVVPVDPATVGSPQEMLEVLRVPQDRFSFMQTIAADDAFFGSGQFVGLGFRTIATAPDELRVLDVFEDSVAENGGLARGDWILEVNGRPIEDILANEGFNASLGPSEVGVVVELKWRTSDDLTVTGEFVKDVVTIPPVARTTVFDGVGGPVGYLLFRNFVDTAVQDLIDAFAFFQAEGVKQVVMDLRYNGGGLLSVAEVLANLMGGEAAAGQIFYTLEFNQANAFRNASAQFRKLDQSVSLERMVFITTGSSASASEMVINGLEPFFDVVLVGDTTFGKPVGQVAVDFCANRLRPVSFRSVNADGGSDFFDGFPVDCVAADDIDFDLGDPAEASLAEALYYAENGVCSSGISVMHERSVEKALADKPRWHLQSAH